MGKNASRRRRDYPLLPPPRRQQDEEEDDFVATTRYSSRVEQAKSEEEEETSSREEDFFGDEEGPRVFAEAFKADDDDDFCGIEEGREDDEKTIVVVVKVSFSFCRSKAPESLKGTNGAGGGGDDEEEKKIKKKNKNDDEDDDDDDENFERILNSVFVSLLVTEGAIKGSAMTLLGLMLHVKVIGSFQFFSGGGGVVSASDIGIACAMPLVLADFAIMNLVFPAACLWRAHADISSPPSLTTAVSNYAKEASLNNPCVACRFIKTRSSQSSRAWRILLRAFQAGFYSRDYQRAEMQCRCTKLNKRRNGWRSRLRCWVRRR